MTERLPLWRQRLKRREVERDRDTVEDRAEMDRRLHLLTRRLQIAERRQRGAS